MQKRTFVVLAVLALFVAPAFAQDHGSGGGESGGGCGDVLGDMIHIKRFVTKRGEATGQPILAQRYIEMPKELPGYGWGYCPIAVNASGQELPFAPLTCDVDPAYADQVVDVDYFGRLNGGRTKERNIRMHFDEVIANIKGSEAVRLDAGGRLELGTGCTSVPEEGEAECATWATVDSPMESMALYHRMMKYGHIATDPLEEDLWAHGDPALGIQYHVALGPEDWKKFDSDIRVRLLPEPTSQLCFNDGVFEPRCALNQPLDKQDFALAASFLGTAANKTGKITVDLVQYVNRFTKITKDTSANPDGGTKPPAGMLPAKVRDCWPSATDPVLPVDPATGEVIPADPAYAAIESCTVADANTSLPNYGLFPDVQEKFVPFGKAGYDRDDRFFLSTVPAIVPPAGDLNPQTFYFDPAVELFPWLEYANPGLDGGKNITGFVNNASDALRAIEFIHNYAVPTPLWDFVSVP